MWFLASFPALFGILVRAHNQTYPSSWGQSTGNASSSLNNLYESITTAFSLNKAFNFSQRMGAEQYQKRQIPASPFGEDERGMRLREYAGLDFDDTNISPEERLLRVAAAYSLSADKDNYWAVKWGETYNWQSSGDKTLSEAFLEFAYTVRFGPDQPLFIKNRIRDFDIAYRVLRKLPPVEYDPITDATSRGLHYKEVTRSYLYHSLLASRMNADAVWRTFKDSSMWPSTTFCTPTTASICDD